MAYNQFAAADPADGAIPNSSFCYKIVEEQVKARAGRLSSKPLSAKKLGVSYRVKVPFG